MSVKRYDFDCYAFYDSARLTVQECDDGDYVLHSDYAALLASHNALREERDKLAQEIMRQVNKNEELHERHNALREAVAALLREQNVLTSVTRSTYDPVQLMDRSEQRDKVRSARSEVDRLIENESPADCKEGK